MNVEALPIGKKDNNGIELYKVIDNGNIEATDLTYHEAWMLVRRIRLYRYNDERYRKLVEEDEKDEKYANMLNRLGIYPPIRHA